MESLIQVNLNLEFGFYIICYGMNGWCLSFVCMLYNIYYEVLCYFEEGGSCCGCQVGDGFFEGFRFINCIQVVIVVRELIVQVFFLVIFS